MGQQLPSVTIKCGDCQSELTVGVGGPEVICSKPGCRRRFKAWSKRKQKEVLEFHASQPSLKRKRLRRLDDGRFLGSYVYDQVQRYRVTGLLDLIDDLETLELLLLGVSSRIGLPLVIQFPVPKGWDNPGKIPVVRNIGRLECTLAEGRISPTCLLLRNLFGSEDCFSCDADCFEQARDGRKDPSWQDLPRRYPCFAGRTEFGYPIVANELLVAVFVTGQLFLDTPEGRAELDAGMVELGRRHPRLVRGKTVRPSVLREAGIEPADLARHLGLEVPDEDEPLLITIEGIRRLMIADAEAMGRVISSDGELAECKRKISDAVKVVQGYVEVVYRERRELSEKEFLTELFALLDSMPSVSREQEQEAWRHTERIIRRITEFQAFRHGAICFADLDNPRRVRLGAWYAPAQQAKTDVADVCIDVSDEHYKSLDDSGSDWFDRDRDPSHSNTRDLVERIHAAVTDSQETPQTGHIGFLRLKDDIVSGLGQSPSAVEAPSFPYALMLLWERIPGSSKDSATKISRRSLDFLQHVCFELSEGLRSWLSVQGLRWAEDSRRQLIANSVHGLRSSLHHVGAKGDMIELMLRKPSGMGQEQRLRGLLAGIRGDIETFRHQIELANLFTVLDAGRLKYEVHYPELPIKLVEVCAERLIDAAKRRSITIDVDDRLLPGTRILCDPGAMDIALMALLDNAVKYSFDRRTVYVRLREDEDQVRIAVEDFGQGILPGDEKKIFQAFQRSRAVDPWRYVPGTGIGLTVARDVVAAHGGTLSVRTTRGTAPSGHSTSSIAGFKVIFEVCLPRKGRRIT